MAARKIGAVIALDGEAKFNSAVQSCTKSLTTMNSEMKLIDAETKGQSNTIDTLTRKQESLAKTLDASNKKQTEVQAGLTHAQEDYKRVGDELDKYKTQLSEAKTKLDAMKASGEASQSEVKKQNDTINSLSETVTKGESAYRKAGDRVESWTGKLNTAKAQTANINNTLEENTKYLNEAKTSTDGCATSIDKFGKQTKEADTSTTALTDTVSKFSVFSVASQYLDTASQSMQKLMSSSLSAAKELDKGYDSIITKTGATGDSLQGMTDIANNLYSTLPIEMSDIGDAVGEVSTRFGESGDKLESTSKQYLEFAQINNTDVSSSIDSTDRILTQFGESTDEAGNYLGMLTKRSQETGKSVTDLMSSIDTNASTLKGLGLNLEQSTNLLSQFETAGIDSSSALRSLKTAVNNYAKEGKSATDGLNDTITSIKQAKTDTEALAIAQDTFGSKGAQAMTDAIREGRFSLDDLSDSLDNYSSTVETTYNETLDPWDKMTVATNNLKEAGSDLAGTALETLQPAVEGLTGIIKDATKAYNNLEPSTQRVIAVTGTFAAGALYLAPKVTKVVMAVKALKAANDATKAINNLSGATDTLAASATGMGSAVTLGLGAFGAAVGVASVLGGVVVAINDVTDASDWASSSSKDLFTDIESAQTALKSSMDSAAESLDDVNSSAEIASGAVSELEQLNSSTDKTAETQAKMKSLVSELNSLYPEMNLQIDDQTSSLSMMNEELEDYVNNLEKTAKAQAYQDAAKEAWDAVVTAETEANKAEKTYQDTLTKRTDIANQLADIKNKERDNQEKAKTVQDELTKAYQNNSDNVVEIYFHLKQELDKLNSATVDYNGTQVTFAQAEEDLNAKLVDANSAVDEQSKAIQGLNDDVKTATDTAKGIGSATAEVNTQMQQEAASLFDVDSIMRTFTTSTDTQTEAAKSSISVAGQELDAFNGLSAGQQQMAVDVTNSVLTMQSNVETALDSQMDMFEQFNGGAATSTDVILANFQSQIDGVTKWEENLNQLVDWGINDDLLGTLEEMGPQGASYVQALVDSGSDELGTVNLKWSEAMDIKDFTNSAGEDLTNGVAEMAAGGADSLSQLGEDLGVSAEETGQNLAQGIVNGLTNAKTELEESGTDTGESLLNSINTTLGVHSPSTITYQSGLDVGAGLVNGLYGNKGTIEFAANDLSNTVISIIQGLGTATDTYTAGLALSAGIVNGLYGNKDSIAFAATDIGESATSSMAAAVQPETALQSAMALSAMLVVGIYANKESTAFAATDVGNTATNNILTSTNASVAYSAGSALSASLVNGIYANKGSVSFAATDVGSTAHASMATSVGTCFDTGSNLSNSLANGILSGESAVIRAASQVATSAITAAHSTLQINSPSKVFVKIGKSIDEGAAKGIVSDSGLVTSAVKETMDFSDFTATSPAYSAVGALGSAAVYNVYIDGIKYNTDDYIDSSLNNFVTNIVRKGQMYSG